MCRKPTQKTHTGEAQGPAQHRRGKAGVGWGVWLGQILATWQSLHLITDISRYRGKNVQL